MRRRPKILFVATDLSTGGGVNKVIRDLTALFRQRLGADVKVVSARSGRPSSYAFPSEVPVQLHARQSLFAYFRLLIGLRRSRPDFAIGSWTQDNVLLTLAFLFSSTKTVLVEHSPWHFHSPAIRVLRRVVYPFASQVIVLNRRDLEHYRRYLTNVRLIPNPFSVPPPTPGKHQRDKLIIAVGHLEPLKNFEDAIRAMSLSRLEEQGWSMAIIGSGSRESRLRQLIAEQGLTRTHIHPPADDLGPWYARASLLVVTSRIESFSLVLAEAMLAGVVPIAYASDGPSFILEDFPNHLVGLGDAELLSRRLVEFAANAELGPLREKLRASIDTRFAPDAVIEQWREMIEACDGLGPC